MKYRKSFRWSYCYLLLSLWLYLPAGFSRPWCCAMCEVGAKTHSRRRYQPPPPPSCKIIEHRASSDSILLLSCLQRFVVCIRFVTEINKNKKYTPEKCSHSPWHDQDSSHVQAVAWWKVSLAWIPLGENPCSAMAYCSPPPRKISSQLKPSSPSACNAKSFASVGASSRPLSSPVQQENHEKKKKTTTETKSTRCCRAKGKGTPPVRKTVQLATGIRAQTQIPTKLSRAKAVVGGGRRGLNNSLRPQSSVIIEGTIICGGWWTFNFEKIIWLFTS